MPSKKVIIDDVILRLTQGAPSDDLELETLQVAYWIQTHLNQVVANEVNEKLKRKETIPAVYIISEEQELLTEDSEFGDGRYYVTLDNEILTVNHGMGVIQVWDEEGNEIKKADVQTLTLIKNMRFAKPTSENVVYSHEGNKIYFPGLKESDIQFEQIRAWYIPRQDILSADDDYEVLISDLSLPILIDLAVETGKQQMYGTLPDESNDGRDAKDLVYHTAIKNPNN